MPAWDVATAAKIGNHTPAWTYLFALASHPFLQFFLENGLSGWVAAKAIGHEPPSLASCQPILQAHHKPKEYPPAVNPIERPQHTALILPRLLFSPPPPASECESNPPPLPPPSSLLSLRGFPRAVFVAASTLPSKALPGRQVGHMRITWMRASKSPGPSKARRRSDSQQSFGSGSGFSFSRAFFQLQSESNYWVKREEAPRLTWVGGSAPARIPTVRQRAGRSLAALRPPPRTAGAAAGWRQALAVRRLQRGQSSSTQQLRRSSE